MCVRLQESAHLRVPALQPNLCERRVEIDINRRSAAPAAQIKGVHPAEIYDEIRGAEELISALRCRTIFKAAIHIEEQPAITYSEPTEKILNGGNSVFVIRGKL